MVIKMRESTVILLGMVGIIIFIGFMMGLTPKFVRKNIQFGVMLPEEACKLDVVKRWKRQYLNWNLILSVIATFPMLAGLFMDKSEYELARYLEISGIISTLLFIVLSGILYLIFYNRAKSLKIEKYSSTTVEEKARVMVSTKFRDERLIVSNVLFGLAGVIIILITSLAPIVFRNQIGEYVPIHWNSTSNVRVVPATVGVFVIAPMVQLFMLGLFMFVNYTFSATKQLISPKNATKSLEQNRRYRLAMSKMVVLAGLGTMLFMSMPQFMMIFDIRSNTFIIWGSVLFSVLVVAITLYVAVKYGQGGERYNPPTTGDDTDYKVVDDDSFWKWGMFYVNPNDPAIFVEKRFGIGTTVNFAKWQAWAFIIGLLVLSGIIVIASISLER